METLSSKKLAAVSFQSEMSCDEEKIVTSDTMACEECNYCTRNEEEMLNHINKSHGVVDYCFICRVGVKSWSDLVSHIRRRHFPGVSGLHICEECGATRSTFELYILHLGKHFNFFPKALRRKRKSKSISSKLIVRSRADSKVIKPVYDVDDVGGMAKEIDLSSKQCPFCAHKARNTSALDDHVRRHLNVREFVCEICQMAFFSKGELLRHSQSKHPNSITALYKCQYCYYYSRRKPMETYGFGSDDRFEPEVVKHFQSEYVKILQRRKTRWDSLTVTQMKKGSKEKRFVRKGIPPSLRPTVWLIISGVQEKMEAEPQRYADLLKQDVPQSISDTITTDVPRTFPENSFFRNDRPYEGLSQPLTNVLRALAVAVPEIGYCQGINFIAALLLLVVRDEMKAFWLLEYLLTVAVPKDYYISTMNGLMQDCEVLSDLVRKKLPDVSKRLESEGVSYVIICTKWFICLFCDTLPLETALRIMDCLLFEGDKILFRVALALFKGNAAALSKCDSFPKILTSIQSMVHEESTLYCHQFMENVFKQSRGLTRRNIEKLRSQHAVQDQDTLQRVPE